MTGLGPKAAEPYAVPAFARCNGAADMSRDILERLKNANLTALQCRGEDWPRSLLSNRNVPAGWIALRQRADGKRVVIPAGENPDPERDDVLLFVRDAELAIPVAVSECRAAGGNIVKASCTIQMRWRRDADELAAARKTFMDFNALTNDRFVQRVTEAGAAAALKQFIRQNQADELVEGDQREALAESLREHLKRFLFGAGLSIERVSGLEFSSDTLKEQQALRRETAERVERIKARQMVEEAALAATQRKLDDLAGVMDKLGAAAKDENMQWHDLLPSLSPAERGRLLENLWRITPDRHTARAIVVVAGQECLWLDPAKPETAVRRITIDDDLGGLRSVGFSPQRNALLIGAASGVWMLDADDGSVTGKFEVPSAEQTRTGFNAAVITGDTLVATHSQRGCWAWPLAQPSAGRALLRPEAGVPKTIRSVVTTSDGRVLFAADDTIRVFDSELNATDRLDTGGKTVTCIHVLGDSLYVGTKDGLVLHDRLDDSRELFEVVHRAHDAVESIHARRWNDLVELVIPADSQGVLGIYGDEGVTTRLLECSTPIRRAWACDDVVVGLSDHRDSLIVMNANMPQRTGREVHVARMTGRSIQDACIVVSSDQGAAQA